MGVRRKDMDDFLEKAAGMHLNGVMEKIKVPFLVTHGAQTARSASTMRIRAMTSSSIRRDANSRFSPTREGGVEHVGADNMSFGRSYIADWFAETLGGRLS